MKYIGKVVTLKDDQTAYFVYAGTENVLMLSDIRFLSYGMSAKPSSVVSLEDPDAEMLRFINLKARQSLTRSDTKHFIMELNLITELTSGYIVPKTLPETRNLVKRFLRKTIKWAFDNRN
jgi:hypothetical protein